MNNFYLKDLDSYWMYTSHISMWRRHIQMIQNWRDWEKEKYQCAFLKGKAFWRSQICQKMPSGEYSREQYLAKKRSCRELNLLGKRNKKAYCKLDRKFSIYSTTGKWNERVLQSQRTGRMVMLCFKTIHT